jgi:hypothetical protein
MFRSQLEVPLRHRFWGFTSTDFLVLALLFELDLSENVEATISFANYVLISPSFQVTTHIWNDELEV